MERYCDIVYLIDCNCNSNSFSNFVNVCIRNLHQALFKYCLGYHELFIRSKIICYGNEKEPFIKESRWYDVFNDKGMKLVCFSALYRNIKTEKAGNTIVLDAIKKAFQVEWTFNSKSRYVVCVISNSYHNKLKQYELDKLCSAWKYDNWKNYYDLNNRRMFIIAPEVRPWREVFECCPKVAHVPLTTLDAVDDDYFQDVACFIIERL